MKQLNGSCAVAVAAPSNAKSSPSYFSQDLAIVFLRLPPACAVFVEMGVVQVGAQVPW